MSISGFRKLVATGAALAGLAVMSAANAVPVTWTDSLSPNAYVGAGGSTTFTHSIVPEFTPGVDLVTSFDLAIDLYDDSWFGLPELNPEAASIKLAGTFTGSTSSSIWTLFTYLPDYVTTGSVAASALAQLNEFGQLTVTVSSLFGDFIVGKSVLSAHGTEGSLAVPEPATLGMLGLGLLGVAFVARRRHKNKIDSVKSLN